MPLFTALSLFTLLGPKPAPISVVLTVTAAPIEPHVTAFAHHERDSSRRRTPSTRPARRRAPLWSLYQSHTNRIPITYLSHTNHIPIAHQSHTNHVPIAYQSHTNHTRITHASLAAGLLPHVVGSAALLPERGSGAAPSRRHRQRGALKRKSNAPSAAPDLTCRISLWADPCRSTVVVTVL